ncbi:MAG: carboxypeptidase regulatory-like domain-containing protein [Candidatus Margulisiibacteriota bacterium]
MSNQSLIKKGLWLFTLLLLGLCFGCLTAAPQWGTINGMLVDIAYTAISGATVQVDNSTTDTLSDGSYSLTRIAAGSKILALSKSGYTTSYRGVTLGRGETAYASAAILAPLDSKITQVNSSGGTVSNTNGSIQLVIPDGALSSTVNVQLTEVPLVAAPYPPPVGYQFIAVIVYVTPADAALAREATLSIPNSTGLADGTNVSFYGFNTALLQWELITATGEAHSASNTITAQIDQFGWIAAIIPITPAAGNITGTITNSSTGRAVPYASVWSSYFSTVADSNGDYTLSSLPSGEVTVEALASGYSRATGHVTVLPGSTVTCDLALTPNTTTGTIVGYVCRTLDAVVIAGARVAASGIETTTSTSGYYTLYNMPAGHTHVYAYANGYLNNYGEGTVYAGATATIEVYLTRTSEAVGWSDNFETDKGWTTSSNFDNTQWQRYLADYAYDSRDNLAPEYVTLPDYDSTLGKLPLAHSYNYYYWYGQMAEQDARGCYIAVQKTGDLDLSGGTSDPAYPYNYGYLDSPSIDISGYAYATLSFWTWWEIEGVNAATGYDQMKVQISINGGFFSDLAVLNPYNDPNVSREAYCAYTSGGYNLAGRWVQHSFDLTSYVGNVIKVRFYFNTVDELYNGFRGWMVDDFCVTPEAISYSSVSSASVLKRPDRGEIKVLRR